MLQLFDPYFAPQEELVSLEPLDQLDKTGATEDLDSPDHR